MLEKKYKFYLAFENSICIDYVTEKLWKVLPYDVIPVVLGGANYTKYLPKKSYIDVNDFQSPEELGKYLLKLDKNDDLYNEYFKWKSGNCWQNCRKYKLCNNLLKINID